MLKKARLTEAHTRCARTALYSSRQDASEANNVSHLPSIGFLLTTLPLARDNECPTMITMAIVLCYKSLLLRRMIVLVKFP